MIDPTKTSILSTLEISSSRWIDGESQSGLSLIEEFTFDLKRVFFLETTSSAVTRGAHAHKVCNQALLTQGGSFSLKISDSVETKEFTSNKNSVLLVPAGIWVEVALEPYSRLIVLCDQPFDESDYIRDWFSFREWKKLT